MNGYIHAARDVTKVSNHQIEAFQSAEFGPLGRVEADGSVRLFRCMASMPERIALDAVAELPRVDIAWSYAGADGAAIDAFVAAGAKAIISAGFPPGRCTPAERQALLRARTAGVLVVQSSRAAAGHVPVQAYNMAEGILAGGGLAPHKARILVLLLLAAGRPAEAIQADLLAA
jgi:L-asparaginase